MDDPGPKILFAIDYNLIGGFAIIILLLSLSAVVSGAEVALFSLNNDDLATLKNNNLKRGEIITALLEKPKKLLATIVITNTFINIAVILYFFKLQCFSAISVPGLRLFSEVTVITILILLFGEVLPKVLAARNNIAVALRIVMPVFVLNKLLTPINVPMRNFTLWLNKKVNINQPDFDVDRLSQALELTDYAGVNREEQKLLEGIVSFGNTDASEVMTPRIDLFAIDIETPYDELLKKVTEAGFSRIPVYEGNIDVIKGVLFLKDLIPYAAETGFNWVPMIKDPYYVPESKKLDDLLREFQVMRRHFAVVVDEYGDTAGIITLEDILEEIVGDISDEFDAGDDVVYSRIDMYNFLFDGKIGLKDFFRITGLDEEFFEEARGEADTLGGFLIELNGNFPEKGQKINFNGNIFTVESVDNRRIKQIKVTLHETHQ